MSSSSGRAGRLAVGVLTAAILSWLWPIGFGGRMPVGGDVTQFSLGPMAVLSRALTHGRLPLWNDLWGYGFPGVGESQMGVFYPPHWLLYGTLPVEHAYTASLVFHTVWGGLGAYFAARRFGASEAGSALGGFAWTACGFFVIHLPHQWAYTTGSWMPWAWGLTWSVLRGTGRPSEPFLLALVLAVQILPGHFQLAFCTQVAILVLAVSATVGVVRRPGGWWSRPLVCLSALAGSFALAAAQVWPTLRLARLASGHRDFDYLSGFAASPLHLVSFFAPGLFQRSPLWRPLVWDPFHTSPEEYLGYVGVVPLFLALVAVREGWRRTPAVGALAAVGGVTLLLSLGPYLPGYRQWSLLPGFSFFRAPSRWLLATQLALCCLAALGFDRIGALPRPTRSLLRFAALGIGTSALVVLLVEVALAGAGRPGWPGVAGLYARAFSALPWREPSVFARAVNAARRPNLDFRVQEAWARQGVRLKDAPRPVFAERRLDVYRQELSVTAATYLALIGLAPLARRRGFRAGLVVLTLLDLGIVGRQRWPDLGPLRTLVSQSPVLAGLAQKPNGSRTLDSLRNMPMVPGAAPVSAYRTLDLPALESLTNLAVQVPRTPAETTAIVNAARATGAAVRIFDPMERRELRTAGVSWPGQTLDVRDPALAGWKFGTGWVAQQGPWASTFLVASVPEPGPRAWHVPSGDTRAKRILREWSGDPFEVLDTLKDARPAEVRSPTPERREIAIRADVESLVVISELADPEWQATWVTGREERPAAIVRAFGRPNQGAWQVVQVPGPGTWTLRLDYRGRDVIQGMAVSLVGLTVFAGLFYRFGRGPASREENG